MKVVVTKMKKNIRVGDCCEVIKGRSLFGVRYYLCQPFFGKARWYTEEHFVEIPK